MFMKKYVFCTTIDKINQQLHDPLSKNSLLFGLTGSSLSVLVFLLDGSSKNVFYRRCGIDNGINWFSELNHPFSLFGFDFSLIRFLPISDNRKVYNTCLVITSFFAIIICAAYISCIGIFSPDLIFLQNPKFAAVFLIFSLLNTLTLINGNAFLALRKGGEFLVQNILLALRIPILILLTPLKSYGIFASMGLAYFFSTIFGLYTLNKLIGVHIQADKHFVQKSFKFSFWNYLSNILANVPPLIMPVMILNLLGMRSS